MKRGIAAAAVLLAVFAFCLPAAAAQGDDGDDLLERELEKITGKDGQTDGKQAERPKKKEGSSKNAGRKDSVSGNGVRNKAKPGTGSATTGKKSRNAEKKQAGLVSESDRKPASEPEKQPQTPERETARTAPEPDVASRSASTTVSFRGGVVGDGWSASGLLEIPLSDYFDLAVRGYYHSFQYEYQTQIRHTRTYRYWYYTYRYYYYTTETRTAEFDCYGGAGYFMWHPTRGCMVDLYAGAGACYESGDVDGGFDPAFRLGATAWLGPLSFTIDYLVNTDSREFIGDVGLHLSKSFSLHAFVDQIDLDDYDLEDDLVCGGGISIAF